MEQKVKRDQQALMRFDNAVAWAEAAVVGLAMIAMAVNTMAVFLGPSFRPAASASEE